jgi:hypothetical protein
MLSFCVGAEDVDISPKFQWNLKGALVAENIIRLTETPEAIRYFASVCDDLKDYDYWFLLSTLWVSYSGGSDLALWKKLFSSGRKNREKSIMKPSELNKFKHLPWFVTIYRAHRPGETDWIAYTLDPLIAARFARERGVDKVMEYRVKKRDILALFTRRGEDEVLVLDKSKVNISWEIMVING